MTKHTGLESIFLKSLEFKDSKQRAAFLDEACASDPSLREEVERLLGSHDAAGSFLEGDFPLLQVTELQCVASRNESVLKTMKDVIGTAPAVALKEDQLPDPVQRVRSVEIPVTEGDGRYQLQGEIARGGMGAVIKGRDTDLGRDLAVKVLLESHQGKPEVVQRFVEEAQIGGQLQHPGIAPVYELGQFEDRRPYFTMKLVKGKTLAALLAARRVRRFAGIRMASSPSALHGPCRNRQSELGPEFAGLRFCRTFLDGDERRHPENGSLSDR